MIDRGYVQRMARYNRWQNENLYGIADGLSDGDRRSARGAFFGSIHATLSHVLWADRVWMSRFGDTPAPAGSIAESVSLYPDWHGLKAERRAFDRVILEWAESVEPAWLAADQTFYSRATQREWTRPRWLLVTHMFNHQTHHRGQVHCMLTQAGGKPHDTDLPVMPDEIAGTAL
ncbi:MAG: DUF664 domain-containing protein [Pseudolabrys sp.]|nr:DUF664 domain-containing protein [Pseudolabrys sp.]